MHGLRLGNSTDSTILAPKPHGRPMARPYEVASDFAVVEFRRRLREDGMTIAETVEQIATRALASWQQRRRGCNDEASRHVRWSDTSSETPAWACISVIVLTNGANMERLSVIKAKYDPDDFLRLNANISPAASARA